MEIVVDAQCGILIDPLGDPGAVAEQLAEWWDTLNIPMNWVAMVTALDKKGILGSSLASSWMTLYKSLIS